MDNFKRVLIKIIIFTVIIAILSASVAEAKKTKKHSSKLSKRHYDHIEKYHNKAKRSTYGRSWGKASYSGYGMPPYLIYNRKLGAYYPYYKYPENNNRRSMNMRKSYDSRRYS
ncbi:uncharacterized protein LOC111350539 [Spodoptera litura]|uniref:Uncharacterized protein LOC111350539 n=1 Tax=Spodoptera litura TaxID=69820 RepID=A0A9J7IJV6_SPOLT|nr:uncharacterized protein LOC111350539 [Spodoptera litura]